MTERTDWLVRLSGESLDLSTMSQLFTSANALVLKEGDEYYLKSVSFLSLDSSVGVLKAARELLGSLNGLARLTYANHKPVEADGHVVEVGPGGKRRHIIASVGTIECRSRASASAVVLTDNGEERAPEEVSELDVWTWLARQNQNIADALRFFMEPTWSNLYKVYEIIADDVGGNNKLKKKSWATVKRLSCFTQMAQSRDALGDDARHASEQYKPPADPMTRTEAQAFIGELLRAWLRTKMSPGRGSKQ